LSQLRLQRTTGGFFGSRGLSLVELMMALALGVGLGSAVIRQYLSTVYLQDLQAHFLETQRNAAYARYLLTQAIHESFAHLCSDETSQSDVSSNSDMGSHIERVSIHAWLHADGATPSINAVQGSGVLRLGSGPCDAGVSDFFYLSHRAGNVENPVAMFRRRQRADGSYANAEELIEGVSDLKFQLIAEMAALDFPTPRFASFDQYFGGDVVMVRVTMTFETPRSLIIDSAAGDPQAFSFSVASRNRPRR
jgi:Tfp pilus assembly protein PilW